MRLRLTKPRDRREPMTYELRLPNGKRELRLHYSSRADRRAAQPGLPRWNRADQLARTVRRTAA